MTYEETTRGSSQGPLMGLRVLELAGIGPGPHAAMLFSDLGADVVRVERPGTTAIGIDPRTDLTLRGRTVVEADLKNDFHRDTVLRLVESADVLLEGFRPGVTERLGLGPSECLDRNAGLIYGRMTGWGQEGPWAARAGHDINYLATIGVLHALGPSERPVPPGNFVGDFGGGSMFLVAGVLAALWERQFSGRGQVVDAAMVDGASVLVQSMWAMRAHGEWRDRREANLLDGGAPFYRTYECRDGGFMAVGSIEPKFFAQLVATLGVDVDLDAQFNEAAWPLIKKAFADRFAERDRDEWARLFAEGDACASPVLTADEALSHPHLAARGTFAELHGVPQPAPAPRFSRSALRSPSRPGSRVVPLDAAVAAWSAHNSRGLEAVAEAESPPKR